MEMMKMMILVIIVIDLGSRMSSITNIVSQQGRIETNNKQKMGLIMIKDNMKNY